MKADYYDILGVAKGANDDELRKAYRKLARKFHPDHNSEPEAEARFKEVGEAYSVLSDPQKRAAYDQFGHQGSGGGFDGGFEGFGGGAGGFGGLGDLFEAFFGGAGGGGGGRQRRRGPERGSDLRLDLEIGFREALFGTEKTIDITHLENCSGCLGTGAKEGSQISRCATCKGMGQVQQMTRSAFGQFTQIATCPRCKGEGQTVDTPCPTCKGDGKKQSPKQLKVKIPAGVDTGARLRVTGEGDAGTRGGPSGDLFIVLHAAPDKAFQRRDSELFQAMPISFTQAALGAEVEIPVLDAEGQDALHKLKVPAGTQNGTVFSVKGQGVPHLQDSRRRGDMHVEVYVQVPTQLTDEETELLVRLEDLRMGRSGAERPHGAGLLDGLKKAFGKG